MIRGCSLLPARHNRPASIAEEAVRADLGAAPGAVHSQPPLPLPPL